MARLRLFLVLILPLVVFAEPTDLSVTRIVLEPVVVDHENRPVNAQYIVYCGNTSRNYIKSTDIGSSTAVNLSSVGIEGINYCAATAYIDGVESSYSNEVVAINTLGKFARVGLDAPGLRLE